MTQLTRWASLALAGCVIGASTASAEHMSSLAGKTITIVVGTSAGSGPDAAARLLARHLAKYLPGRPVVGVQNMPGGNQTIAANYLERRVAPDGSTLMLGSSSVIDPMVFRSASALYDPKKLKLIGGVGRCGSVIFIAKEAERRLHDAAAAPVVIGSVGSYPRSPMLPALWGIEYLGWNAKWVAGYPGTQEVMLALDRGEVEMSSTGVLFQIEDRLKSGALKILNQSGTIQNGKLAGCAEFGDAPLFPDQIAGRITDPIAQNGFDYWLARNNLDKWIGLPSRTPDDILEVYREAYGRIAADEEFVNAGSKISEGFVPLTASDVESEVRALADTSPETLDYIKATLRKQGLRIR